MTQMQNRENTMIDHLLNWKLADLVESYDIDLDSEIEVALNKLIEYVITDIKESDSYANKNN